MKGFYFDHLGFDALMSTLASQSVFVVDRRSVPSFDDDTTFLKSNAEHLYADVPLLLRHLMDCSASELWYLYISLSRNYFEPSHIKLMQAKARQMARLGCEKPAEHLVLRANILKSIKKHGYSSAMKPLKDWVFRQKDDLLNGLFDDAAREVRSWRLQKR